MQCSLERPLIYNHPPLKSTSSGPLLQSQDQLKFMSLQHPTLCDKMQYYQAESMLFTEDYIWELAFQLLEVLNNLFVDHLFQPKPHTIMPNRVILSKFGLINYTETQKLLLSAAEMSVKYDDEQFCLYERTALQDFGVFLLLLCNVFNKETVDCTGHMLFHPNYLQYSYALRQFIESCISCSADSLLSISSILQNDCVKAARLRVLKHRTYGVDSDLQALVLSSIQTNNEVVFYDCMEYISTYGISLSAIRLAVTSKAHRILPILCDYLVARSLIYPLPVVFGTNCDVKPYAFDLVEVGKHDQLPVELNMTSVLYRDKTALMLSVCLGNYLCTRLLLCEMGIANHEGLTALMFGAIHNRPSCVRLLLTEMTTVDVNGCTALMHAAQNGSLEVLPYLLSECGAVNLAGQTALMLAASKGHVECVRFLAVYEYGMRCKKQKLAIQYALERNYPQCVQVLLEHEVKLLPTKGKLALMRAAECGHARIVQLLCPLQGRVVDEYHKTALLYGMEANASPDALVSLYETEGMLSDVHGSALHYAVQNQKHKYLLGLKWFNDSLDDLRKLPIDYALEKKSTRILLYLLAGMQFDENYISKYDNILRNYIGTSPDLMNPALHLLAFHFLQRDSPEYLQLLSTFYVEEPTQLMIAVQTNRPRLVLEYLDQAGAVYSGKTALIMAIEADANECINLLLDRELGIFILSNGILQGSALYTVARLGKINYMELVIDELYLLNEISLKMLFTSASDLKAECLRVIEQCVKTPMSQALEYPYSTNLHEIAESELYKGELLTGILLLVKNRATGPLRRVTQRSMWMQTPSGLSPLMLAVELNFAWGVDYLKSTCRLKDNEGKTALVRGIEKNVSPEVLKPLLQLIGAINNGIDTPLTYVIKKRLLQYIEASLPLFWELAPDGKTAMRVAEEVHDEAIIEMLSVHRLRLQDNMSFFTRAYDTSSLIPNISRKHGMYNYN